MGNNDALILGLIEGYKLEIVEDRVVGDPDAVLDGVLVGNATLASLHIPNEEDSEIPKSPPTNK